MEKSSADNVIQFLIFKLGTEEYGLDIRKVTTIIEKNMSIARVPHTPEFLIGVINLRGEIIPVMDLRKRFAMPEIDDTDDTRIIIIKIDDVAMGIVVDMVSEVIDLTEDSIEKINRFSSSYTNDYIMGAAKLEDRIVTLLNLEELLVITHSET